jgi:Rps23 Pro-64 3,4-dihydroxylase Tpa1-like proline 4-hydroxylase
MYSEEIIKIDSKYLEFINQQDCTKYFGNWINNIDELREKFIKAEPFDNIVIDNFLNDEYIEKIEELFNFLPLKNQPLEKVEPNLENNKESNSTNISTDNTDNLALPFPKVEKVDDWHEYMNPIEVKYAFDDIEKLPEDLKNFFYYLSTNQITNIFRKLTNIPDLEYDEYLHGAGLHSHPKYGRLNIHLDYELHPYSFKERRINIILFLNKIWDPSWNGANELWNNNATKCIQKTEIKFNRVIIFKTNDISWHGLPEKLNCPENIFRKSLAYYYVSPLNTMKSELEYRKKAKFIKRPEDKYDKNLEELYKIRPNRRITKDDLVKYMPNWKKED